MGETLCQIFDIRVITFLEKSDYERFPLGFSYFALQLSAELYCKV